MSALIPQKSQQQEGYNTGHEQREPGNGIMHIGVEHIKPNPYQPRRNFDQTMLSELADSIKEHGIVEPIIVTVVDGHYYLVVGERRLLAAQKAGLKEVPAVIKDFAGPQLLEIALIENIQRQDLNALERAQAYYFLIREHGFTQEKLAERMGKSRPAIANTLRLLNLPYSIREELLHGELSEGHARALLMLEDESKKEEVWAKIKKNTLSVRETEMLVRALNNYKKARVETNARYSQPDGWEEVAEELTGIFSAKINLKPRNKNSGRIEINYSSPEELERIVDMLLCLRKKEQDSLNVSLL